MLCHEWDYNIRILAFYINMYIRSWQRVQGEFVCALRGQDVQGRPYWLRGRQMHHVILDSCSNLQDPLMLADLSWICISPRLLLKYKAAPKVACTCVLPVSSLNLADNLSHKNPNHHSVACIPSKAGLSLSPALNRTSVCSSKIRSQNLYEKLFHYSVHRR